MASVVGTQTNETPKSRRTILRGTAVLVNGDDSLSIDIPFNSQAAPGRQSNVEFTVALSKKDQFIIRGTAMLKDGDDSLLIAIPIDFQAPSGKEHITNWTIFL